MIARRLERRIPACDPARLAGPLPPLLARLYANRGVQTPDEVDHRLRHLLPPDGLHGIDGAARLLAATIAARTPIIVIGDYDCDGATGTAVAVRGLRMLGAAAVETCMPNRQRHGYGLSPGLVDEIPVPPPALLVTVDSGIACRAGVARARERGYRVLVTDHHLPGAVLPEADAIVNPNQAGDGFPSKALAGVGVVFYLLAALRALRVAAGELGRDEADLGSLLDLVALGTVADMVPLDRNNRVLVEAGLRRIRAGRASAGVAALFEVAGRDPAAASTRDLGYAIGPRVNAAGRLEDISLGLRCLLADDATRALAPARELDAINRQRRDLQAEMTAQALDRVAVQGNPCHGLVVHDDTWHAGVVGLIAGKLKERHQRPVVALAPAGDGSGLWRGSARSIDGVHVRDVLAAVDVAQPGLMVRFGGHAMAAGLSIDGASISAFARAFDAAVRQALGGEAPHEALWCDGPLGRDELTLETAELLATAVPWGQAFPAPLFDDRVDVIEQRVVGNRHLRLRVRTADGLLADAIAFGLADQGPLPARAHIAYELGIDEWRGERRIQLMVRHAQPG